MRRIRIGSRAIGRETAAMVIAEIGVNHDGSLERAMELVDQASACGADAVKVQVFRAARLMNAQSRFAEYQQSRCDDADAIAMLRRYELSDDALQQVVQRVRGKGMIPLATPFSVDDVDTIAELDLPAVKIASPDLVNQPLLARAAQLGRPLLISTGAATMDEIAETVDWLRNREIRFALLHCVSSYPTAAEDANLSWIGQLAEWFDVAVGYSDHTTELLSGALAIASGAMLVEKHLTYDRSAIGPDHSASADPQQFAQYVRMIRAAEQRRGGGIKRVLPVEQDVRQVSRQSLVLRRNVRSGERIGEQDLLVQRPGTGIPAAKLSDAVGKKARRTLKAGTLLQWDMLDAA
jgi:N,N'-diacetyllegionaminate synthase